MLELDAMSSPARMDQIIAQIRKLEARYKELGGILHGSYAAEDEDE